MRPKKLNSVFSGQFVVTEADQSIRRGMRFLWLGTLSLIYILKKKKSFKFVLEFCISPEQSTRFVLSGVSCVEGTGPRGSGGRGCSGSSLPGSQQGRWRGADRAAEPPCSGSDCLF